MITEEHIQKFLEQAHRVGDAAKFSMVSSLLWRADSTSVYSVSVLIATWFSTSSLLLQQQWLACRKLQKISM